MKLIEGQIESITKYCDMYGFKYSIERISKEDYIEKYGLDKYIKLSTPHKIR